MFSQSFDNLKKVVITQRLTTYSESRWLVKGIILEVKTSGFME